MRDRSLVDDADCPDEPAIGARFPLVARELLRRDRRLARISASVMARPVARDHVGKGRNACVGSGKLGDSFPHAADATTMTASARIMGARS